MCNLLPFLLELISPRTYKEEFLKKWTTHPFMSFSILLTLGLSPTNSALLRLIRRKVAAFNMGKNTLTTGLNTN